MKTKIERIKEIAKELAELFPGHRFDLNCCTTEPHRTPEFWIFDFKTYEEASKALSEMGFKTRQKDVTTTYTRVFASTNEIRAHALGESLPPTCHVEKYIERVPKTETVVKDEFVEIERTRVVCSDKEAKNEPINS